MNSIFKIASMIVMTSIALSAYPQSYNSNIEKAKVVHKQCVNFTITPALRDLENFVPPEKEKVNKLNKMRRREYVNPNALPKGKDPVLQQTAASRIGQPPIVSFEGNGGSFPPDPSGAAGPEHYFQAVNSGYSIYDKQGNELVGKLNLSNLWPGSVNEGDPIVLYDRFADRWFMTQFQSFWSTGANSILIAVSTSPDPTGTYYTYQFDFNSFPDYPKYSIWTDGYYMSANMGSENAVVFNRNKMTAGDPTADMVALTYPSFGSTGFTSVLPADADGELPPYGTPNYQLFIADDAWSGNSVDHLKLFEFDVDWATPANSSITLVKEIETEPYDTEFTQQWDDIEQPGTSQRLDGVPGVPMYRAQYTRWMEHNTIMLCHTVDVDATNHSGVRWYELRDDGAGDFEIYQQGTFAPDEQSRFMGSIAMDLFGNIGLGYSVSGPDVFPSLRYTGRIAGDALGEMTFEEQVGAAGSTTQSGTNRFGDYSHMSLDPTDDKTFWFTGEYLGDAGESQTRIFSFNLHDLTEIGEEHMNAPEGKAYQVGDQLKIELKGVSSTEPVNCDVFGVNGQLLKRKKASVVANFTTFINISDLAAGPYIVRIANSEFQVFNKIVLN